MTFWRRFSRVMLYISLVVTFILVIIITYNISNQWWSSAGYSLLAFGIGIFVVLVIHSIWGSFIENSEDIAEVLDEIEKLKKNINTKNPNPTASTQQCQTVQYIAPANANGHVNRRYAIVNTEPSKQVYGTPTEISPINNGFSVVNNDTVSSTQMCESSSTNADITMNNEVVFEQIVWQCCECGTFNNCNDNICKGCGK